MGLTRATFSMIEGAQINALDHGADPTGATNSSPAIQAAIDEAIAAGGGTVYIPSGTYLCDDAITFASTVISVSIVGDGANNSGNGATTLTYSGTAAEFINMPILDTRFVSFEKLKIQSNNAAFTGTLLRLCGYNCTISQCSFNASINVQYLIDLSSSVDTVVNQVHCRGAQYCMNVGSANSTVVQQSDFGSYNNFAVTAVSAQALTFQGCSFEQDQSGTLGLGIYGTDILGLNVVGCWFGDVVTTSGSGTSQWISGSGSGWSIVGNYINGDGFHKMTAIAITGTTVGLSVIGNYFSNFVACVYINTGMSSEVSVISNKFYQVDATLSGTADVNGNLVYQKYATGTSNGVLVASSIEISSSLITTPVTVSALPTPDPAYTGQRAFVSDATTTTFASIVAGGGGNKVPVYCDGGNWKIG